MFCVHCKPCKALPCLHPSTSSGAATPAQLHKRSRPTCTQTCMLRSRNPLAEQSFSDRRPLQSTSLFDNAVGQLLINIAFPHLPRTLTNRRQLHIYLAALEIGFGLCLLYGIATGAVALGAGYFRVATSVMCAAFFLIQYRSAHTQVSAGATVVLLVDGPWAGLVTSGWPPLVTCAPFYLIQYRPARGQVRAGV